MAVRNHEACGGISGDGSFIAFHLNFLDGVDNFLAVLEFIQSGKGIRPVVATAEGLGISDRLAICQQLYSNAFRLDAVLIVVVFPNLPDRDTGLARRVAVGDVEAIHLRGITRYGILGNGVDDFLTTCVLRQIGKAPLPAVFCSNRFGLYRIAIGIEPDGDRGRTLAILVIRIVPRLGTRDLSGLRSVAVRNHEACGGISGDGSFIAFHLNFLDGVDNFLAVLEFIQSGKGIRPVVATAEGLGISDRLAICQQLYSNAFRLDAVLIVVVFPNLPDRDTGLARRVAVGDVEAIHLRGITRYGILGNGVDDFITIRILRQIGKTPLPAILCGYGLRLLCQFLPVGIDPDDDRLRPLAVLIVVVVPCFGAGNSHGLRGIAVGDGEAPGSRTADFSRIAAYRRFFYGIIDLFTILKFIQIFKGTFPAILFSQSQRLVCWLTVSIQCHSYGAGAFAVLIVIILPDLFHRDVDLRSIEAQVMITACINHGGNLLAGRHYDVGNECLFRHVILQYRLRIGIQRIISALVFRAGRVFV